MRNIWRSQRAIDFQSSLFLRRQCVSEQDDKLKLNYWCFKTTLKCLLLLVLLKFNYHKRNVNHRFTIHFQSTVVFPRMFFQVSFLVSYENCWGNAFRDKVLTSLSGSVGFLSLASEMGAVLDFPEIPEVASQSIFIFLFICYFYVLIKCETGSTVLTYLQQVAQKQQLQTYLHPDFNPEEPFLDKGGWGVSAQDSGLEVLTCRMRMGQESLFQLHHYRKANRVGLLSQETRPCPKQGGPEIPLRQLREFSHPGTANCFVFNLAPVFISWHLRGRDQSVNT